VLGTLLGPEGSGAFVAFGFSVRALLAGRTATAPVGVVVGVGAMWGSARILRTTQWTRASL
jgi:hypothetical protein